MPVASHIKRFISRRTAIAAGLVLFCTALFVHALFRPTVIIPPENPAVSRPVYLLVHDRHSSLVVPKDGDGLIRYSYGDWQYYAEGKTGALSATRAVLWPTTAAFGRREFSGAATPQAIHDAVGVFIDRMFTIPVETTRMDQLRARLDELHRSRPGPRLQNNEADMEFVTHPHYYTGVHNSNRVVANWLEEAGCRISGHALLSRWRVAKPGREWTADNKTD